MFVVAVVSSLFLGEGAGWAGCCFVHTADSSVSRNPGHVEKGCRAGTSLAPPSGVSTTHPAGQQLLILPID